MKSTTVNLCNLSIYYSTFLFQDFFVSGTFKVVTEIVFQLFVIHAVYRDHVFPVLFVLLPGKSDQLYEKMMNDIMQLVPRWSPQRMIMDFKKAAMNMITGCFPTTEP